MYVDKEIVLKPNWSFIAHIMIELSTMQLGPLYYHLNPLPNYTFIDQRNLSFTLLPTVGTPIKNDNQ